VHRALELLFTEPPAERTVEHALSALDRAVTEFQTDPEFTLLGLDAAAEAAFVDDAERLVRKYFVMEDPRTVRDIGLELRLEVQVGALTLRGIIDRLDLDENGELVVTDYKTGRPPFASQEQSKLGGVHFYAFMCQQLFGKRPAKVQLLYLSTGETIVARPTEQSVAFLPRRTLAVYSAVEKACAAGDFRPRTSGLCKVCAFQQWCPSFGGDPERAATEAHAIFAGLTADAAARIATANDDVEPLGQAAVPA